MRCQEPYSASGTFCEFSVNLIKKSLTICLWACVEKCAGPKQLPVSILVLPCIRRGIGPVRSPCDRSALVAQYKTHPFLVFAGEEILSGSEKAYRIVFARNAAVCRDRRADSLDCYRTLKQYMGDAPRCMASSNTPTRECNDLPYLRT